MTDEQYQWNLPPWSWYVSLGMVIVYALLCQNAKPANANLSQILDQMMHDFCFFYGRLCCRSIEKAYLASMSFLLIFSSCHLKYEGELLHCLSLNIHQWSQWNGDVKLEVRRSYRQKRRKTPIEPIIYLEKFIYYINMKNKDTPFQTCFVVLWDIRLICFHDWSLIVSKYCKE